MRDPQDRRECAIRRIVASAAALRVGDSAIRRIVAARSQIAALVLSRDEIGWQVIRIRFVVSFLACRLFCLTS